MNDLQESGLWGGTLCMVLAAIYVMTYINPTRNALTRFVYRVTAWPKEPWLGIATRRWLLILALLCFVIGLLGFAFSIFPEMDTKPRMSQWTERSIRC